MTADNVKAVILGVAGIAVAVTVWKVYSTAKQAGTALSDAAGQVEQGIIDGFQGLKNSVANMADSMTNSAKETLGLTKPAGWTDELPLAQWSTETKQFIRDSLRIRNQKVTGSATDFTGWHVYTNGTIISPVGEYFQLSSAGQGIYTASAVYSPTGAFPSVDPGIAYPTSTQLANAWQDNVNAGILGVAY